MLVSYQIDLHFFSTPKVITRRIFHDRTWLFLDKLKTQKHEDGLTGNNNTDSLSFKANFLHDNISWYWIPSQH